MRLPRLRKYPSLAADSRLRNQRPFSRLGLQKMAREKPTNSHYQRAGPQSGSRPSPPRLVGGRPQAQPPSELRPLPLPSQVLLLSPALPLHLVQQLLISLRQTLRSGLIGLPLAEEPLRNNIINLCLLSPPSLYIPQHNTTQPWQRITLFLIVINLYRFQCTHSNLPRPKMSPNQPNSRVLCPSKCRIFKASSMKW